MGIQVFPQPSSSSEYVRNSLTKVFSTYQSTGTYTYSTSIAAGHYAIVADAVDNDSGSVSPITYTFTAPTLSGTFQNNGNPLYFYTASTQSQIVISGGTTTATTYPQSYSTTKPALSTFTGPSVVSITPYPTIATPNNNTSFEIRVTLSNGISNSYGVSNFGNTVALNYATPSYMQSPITSSLYSNIFKYGTGDSGYTSLQQWATYGNGILAVIAYNEPTLFVSGNGGNSWMARLLPATPTVNTYAATISYLNNIWVYAVQTSTANFVVYTSTDTITWTQRGSSATNIAPIWSAYGGRYVIGLNAVSSGTNNLFTSTDGVTWGFASLAGLSKVTSVVYAATKYVATGSNGGVTTFAYYSTDAVTWTGASPNAQSANPTVAHNGSVFFLHSGSSTSAWTSTDAITWTSRTSPVSGNTVTNVTTIGTLFFIRYNDYSSSAYISTDGITWTNVASNVQYLTRYSSTYGRSWTNLVLGIGNYAYQLTSWSNNAQNQYDYNSPQGNNLGVKTYFSSTGVEGTSVGIIAPRALKNASGSLLGHIPGYLSTTDMSIILTSKKSYYSSTNVNTSNQDPAWTQVVADTFTTGVFPYTPSGLPFYGSVVGLYASATTLYQQYSNTSSPLYPYTYNSKALSGTWYSFVWANGVYLVGGASGALYTASGASNTSISGLTFTSRTSTFSTNAIRAIAFGASKYIIGGDNGSLATSTDGVTWTSRTSGFGSTTIRTISAKPSTTGTLIVAAGDNGTLTTSTDGITWTVRSSGTTANLTTSIPFNYTTTYYPLVVGGNNGVLLYSNADGSSWTLINSNPYPFRSVASENIYNSIYNTTTYGSTPVATTYLSTAALGVDYSYNNINVVAYGNNLYIAAGQNGQLYTSTNASTWTSQSAGTFEDITAAAYLNATYVIGTIEGNIYTSTNGSSWTARTSGITLGNQINYLGYLNGQYYAGYSLTLFKYGSGSQYYNNSNNNSYGYNYPTTSYYLAFTGYCSTPFLSGGIQTSTDLITWTSKSTNSSVNSMAYTGSQFLTVNGNMGITNSGYGATIDTSTFGRPLYASPDLSYFYQNASFLAANTSTVPIDVAYNNGYTCVITASNGGNSTNNIYYSTDLLTWTTARISLANKAGYENYYLNYTNYGDASASLRSVTAGPGSTFIISGFDAKNDAIGYILNPVAGTLTVMSFPSNTGKISVYKHNVAYNSSNGTILVANSSGILASGTVSTTTTSTYYPSIFTLYAVTL